MCMHLLATHLCQSWPLETFDDPASLLRISCPSNWLLSCQILVPSCTGLFVGANEHSGHRCQKFTLQRAICEDSAAEGTKQTHATQQLAVFPPLEADAKGGLKRPAALVELFEKLLEGKIVSGKVFAEWHEKIKSDQRLSRELDALLEAFFKRHNL